MANVITLPDGRNETIFDEQDFLWLIDRYMGFDARCWLEDLLTGREDDSDDLEKEADRLYEHHKEVMAELRKESETISGLIREKEIDRKALSAAAGSICSITWKEMNG